MRNRFAATLLALSLLWLNAAFADSGISLSYGKQTYSGDDLPAGLRFKLYELEVEFDRQRRQAVDEYVMNRYVRESAEARDVELRDLQQELMRIDEPSDAEVEAFYQANQGRIQGSLSQVRPQLVQYLKNQALAERQSQLLEQIRRERNYVVQSVAPVVPVFEVDIAGQPSKGAAEAAVTVVEFADYQCPHCKTARGAVSRLLDKYEGKLRVVYRDFPINPSGISRKVAVGAYCAGEQDKFWEYHDLAFDRQSYLRVVTPSMLAKELELDEDSFAQCFQAPRADRAVAASEREARRLGLSGTPTFFVNGRRLQIHGDLESNLEQAIESALAEAG